MTVFFGTQKWSAANKEAFRLAIAGRLRLEHAGSMDGDQIRRIGRSNPHAHRPDLGARRVTGSAVARKPSSEPAFDLESELEHLHPRSFGWALSCCRCVREEASDVLQATYLKVLDGRARFGKRSLFSTWLFGVIRRTAAERRRRRTTRSILLLRHAREIVQPTLASTESLSVSAGRLQEALAALPRRQREILHLVFYDELSIREAAAIMEIGIGTARIHYDRAKKRLRSWLQEEYEQGMNR
jgi:RNA polymerase sigma factor (sigma-70 family)